MKDMHTVVAGTKLLEGHPLVLDFQLIGSALYHPEPKDTDFLVLVKDLPPKPKQGLSESIADILADAATPGPGFLIGARAAFGHEWSLCPGEYATQDDKWGAIRNDTTGLNFIVTIDPEWYKRARLANEVCVALKLMDKGDRIVVYRIIRDGYSAEEANNRRNGAR